MKTGFELFVAKRYLRARRKEAVISVITVISVLGVAAGVMALVIALGVNNGFRATLQRNLLGAMAHINVMPKQPGDGIDNWQQMAARLRKVPHVTAVSPALYDGVYLVGPLQSTGAVLKGMDVNDELTITGALRHLLAGSLDRLRDPDANPPGIILGSRPGGGHGHGGELDRQRGQPDRRRTDAAGAAARHPPLPRGGDFQDRFFRGGRPLGVHVDQRLNSGWYRCPTR